MDNNSFYLKIEEGVREWVYKLRNHGINTECSCHHDGYIQCQTLDPTEEIRIIKSVLMENNVEDFNIVITITSWKFATLVIRSPHFIFKNKNQ